MKNRKNIINILENHSEELEKEFKVKRIGVFGSFSRGEERKSSDIDILVEFNQPVGYFLFSDLEEYLSNILDRKVDLVTKKALKPIMKDKILNDTVYAK